jgi:hypothetical protein
LRGGRPAAGRPARSRLLHRSGNGAALGAAVGGGAEVVAALWAELDTRSEPAADLSCAAPFRAMAPPPTPSSVWVSQRKDTTMLVWRNKSAEKTGQQASGRQTGRGRAMVEPLEGRLLMTVVMTESMITSYSPSVVPSDDTQSVIAYGGTDTSASRSGYNLWRTNFGASSSR